MGAWNLVLMEALANAPHMLLPLRAFGARVRPHLERMRGVETTVEGATRVHAQTPTRRACTQSAPDRSGDQMTLSGGSVKANRVWPCGMLSTQMRPP
jgi:hypothetical protein